jgi:hypothetical protein
MTSDTGESRSHEAVSTREDRAEIVYIDGRIAFTPADTNIPC